MEYHHLLDVVILISPEAREELRRHYLLPLSWELVSSFMDNDTELSRVMSENALLRRQIDELHRHLDGRTPPTVFGRLMRWLYGEPSA